MTTNLSEHDQVVSLIQNSNSERFDVLSNVGNEKHFVGAMFPDLIFMIKGTETPAVIIEVRKNGSIAQCIQQWKTVQNIPAVLYIVVPQSDLQTAKSIASVVGLPVRFGFYEIGDTGSISSVRFE